MEQTVSNEELKKILQDVDFNSQEPVDAGLTKPMTDEELRSWSADKPPMRGDAREPRRNNWGGSPVNAVVNYQLADLPILEWTVRILKLSVGFMLASLLLSLPGVLLYLMAAGWLTQAK